MTNQQILVFGGLAVILAMLLLSRSLRGRRKVENRIDQLHDFRKQSEAREGLEQLAVEVQELSRESIARLDTRIKMLQTLIADADARIAKLQGAVAAPIPAKGSPTAVQQKVFDLADRGATVADIGRETGLERGEVELILGIRGLPQDKRA